MRRLYRLQTRLGLTGPEGTAALVLLAALAGGGVARHLQATSAPVPPDFYAAAAAPRQTGKPPPARTNINTASAQDLQRLPRIGPALAQRIVEHRRTHGPFRGPDQITDVRGIGEKTLEKLRPWIHI